MIAIPSNHRMLNMVDPVRRCPLTTGLIGWWQCIPGLVGGSRLMNLCRLGDRDGFHGTLTNMDPATDWVGPSGRPGGFGALDFDGSNDQVFLGTSSALSISTFSIAFWLRTSATSGSPIGWMNAATNAGWHIKSFTGGVLAFETTSSGFASISTSIGVHDNAWRHFVLTCAGSSATQQWYINGIADNSGTLALNNSSESKAFGCGTSGGSFDWAGRLDDVPFFNRVLSVSEVLALYNDSRRGHPEMLNWIRPRYFVPEEAAPPSGGNRRRRVLIAGAA